MKRTFNIFDGLFLLALYFKLTGTGLVVCWPAVFLPYLLEGALAIVSAFSGLFGWADRVKYWFWKFALNRRVDKAGDKARKFMDDKFKEGQARSGNPGRFIDPQNTGK